MCPLNWNFPPWMLCKFQQKINDNRRQDGHDDSKPEEKKNTRRLFFFFKKHGIDGTFGKKGTL